MKKTAYFSVIDHAQGSCIGDAEVKYYPDWETEKEAINFFIANNNKHRGTAWELYKVYQYA